MEACPACPEDGRTVGARPAEAGRPGTAGGASRGGHLQLAGHLQDMPNLIQFLSHPVFV